jgi:two-component system NtrC family sensor kinase
MRKLTAALLLATFCLTVHAQQKKIDSLLTKIDQTSDPEKIRTLSDELITIPQGTIALLKKGRQNLANAEVSGKVKYKERALLIISYASANLHNTPEMLDASLQGVRISRDLKDYRYLARFLHTVGLAYTFQQDVRRSNSYYLMSASVALTVRDTRQLLTNYSNMESCYVTLKMPDSALFFARLELQLVSHLDSARNSDDWQLAFGDYGEVMASMNKPDSALRYYGRAYQIAKRDVQATVRPFLENNIAKTYLQVGKPDSAAKYALQAYQESSSTNLWEFTANAAETLAKIYEGRDDKKSLFYLKAQMAAQDSSNAAEKSRQFQLIAEKDRLQAQELKAAQEKFNTRVRLYVVIGAAVVLLIIGIILWRNNRKQKQTNLLLSEQKEEIEAQRDSLEEALDKIKTTQTQLIQSEKMASLGELTAGIAHEIQNPLNFVNNFSDVNRELIEEMEQEIEKGDLEEIKAIAIDIKENEKKINMHGKRADFIVKGMLQHSRASSGERQPTNFNVLAEEFFKLSYQGLRAKDKDFNAELITHFDANLPKANVVQQDMGRVLLNLFNNAFYAVNQRSKTAGADYKPAVEVSTVQQNGSILVSVKDNGTGIPDNIREKIMQPFFTTKPTGEGTGLGLSLSYDIVVKGHGGSIQVNSREDEGSEFVVKLPLS